MTAIITAKDTIAPRQWPNDLARVNDGTYDSQIRTDWRHVPTTADAILDWIEIIPATGPNIRGGEKRVVYAPAVLDPQMRKYPPTDMSFFVHGFIRSLNLSPLGNWSTKEGHAPSAIQHLTLVSNGHTTAFDPQLIAIDHLKEVVHTLTGADELPRAGGIPEAIRIERNVFFKVRTDDDIDPPPRTDLTDEVDPGRKARRIMTRWGVHQLLPTYLRRPDGRDKPVPFHAFRIGDFLEVTVAPQIHTASREGQRQPTLQFVMKKVVKIRSAAEAKALLCPPKPTTSKSKPPADASRMDTT